MDSKIANPKVEVPSGMRLNDKDYLNCLLSSLKELEKNYAISLTEASNEYLFSIYKEIFDSISSLQREVFELAFRKGWYSLENVVVEKIDSKVQMLTKEYQDMNS